MIERLELRFALEKEIPLNRPRKPRAPIISSMLFGRYSEDVVQLFKSALSFIGLGVISSYPDRFTGKRGRWITYFVSGSRKKIRTNASMLRPA